MATLKVLKYAISKYFDNQMVKKKYLFIWFNTIEYENTGFTNLSLNPFRAT